MQAVFGALCFPGLINSINLSVNIPSVLERIYDVNWFLNTFGVMFVYWLLCTVFPARETLVSMTISSNFDEGVERDADATHIDEEKVFKY